MKKLMPLLFIIMLLTSSSLVYADMGMPESPQYTVVINIYGCSYYYEYEDYESDLPDGALDGGQAFYVWLEYSNGGLWGTTDPSAGPDDSNTFIIISSAETTDGSEFVSYDVGEPTGDTVYALCTDKLNVRSGPGTGFRVIKTLEKETLVTYEYTFNAYGTWMYVSADGVEGWVSGDYLRRTEKPSVQPPEGGGGDEGGTGTTGTGFNPVQGVAGLKRSSVIGIVLICVGAAILISTVVILVLNKK